MVRHRDNGCARGNRAGRGGLRGQPLGGADRRNDHPGRAADRAGDPGRSDGRRRWPSPSATTSTGEGVASSCWVDSRARRSASRSSRLVSSDVLAVVIGMIVLFAVALSVLAVALASRRHADDRGGDRCRDRRDRDRGRDRRAAACALVPERPPAGVSRDVGDTVRDRCDLHPDRTGPRRSAARVADVARALTRALLPRGFRAESGRPAATRDPKSQAGRARHRRARGRGCDSASGALDPGLTSQAGRGWLRYARGEVWESAGAGSMGRRARGRDRARGVVAARAVVRADVDVAVRVVRDRHGGGVPLRGCCDTRADPGLPNRQRRSRDTRCGDVRAVGVAARARIDRPGRVVRTQLGGDDVGAARESRRGRDVPAVAGVSFERWVTRSRAGGASGPQHAWLRPWSSRRCSSSGPNLIPAPAPRSAVPLVIMVVCFGALVSLSWRQLRLYWISRHPAFLAASLAVVSIALTSTVWMGRNPFTIGWWTVHALDVCGVFGVLGALWFAPRLRESLVEVLEPVSGARPARRVRDRSRAGGARVRRRARTQGSGHARPRRTRRLNSRVAPARHCTFRPGSSGT